MTLPLVAAPSAAAPAARHARAAGAVTDDAAPGFDAMLAGSAGGGVACAGADAALPDQAPSPHADDWLSEPGADLWVFTWMPAPPAPDDALPGESKDPEVALPDEVDVPIDPAKSADASRAVDPAAGLEAGAAGIPGTRVVIVNTPAPLPVPAEMGASARLPEEVTAPSPAVPALEMPPLAHQKIDAAQIPEATPAAAPPALAAGTPAADGRPSGPDEPASRSTAGLEPMAVPANSAEPAARRGAGSARSSEDVVKSTARAALASAVAELQVREPGAAAQVMSARTTPDAVATSPLPAAAIATFQAPVADRPAQTPPARTAMPEPGDVSGQLAGPAPAADVAGRAGAERHGHRDEPGHAAWGRPAGQDRLASLPASMVFPGQATFAAALEHAVPLAPGIAVPAAPYVPATVGPQLVRAVHMQVAQGGGEMTLTLNPAHLGTVTLEVKVDQQRVVATLIAETPAVRGWVAAHEQDLKCGLADLGLQLDELVVKDEDDRRQHSREQPAPERRRQPEPDEDVEFEIPL